MTAELAYERDAAELEHDLIDVPHVSLRLHHGLRLAPQVSGLENHFFN